LVNQSTNNYIEQNNQRSPCQLQRSSKVSSDGEMSPSDLL